MTSVASVADVAGRALGATTGRRYERYCNLVACSKIRAGYPSPERTKQQLSAMPKFKNIMISIF
jgi:hypothetical protein